MYSDNDTILDQTVLSSTPAVWPGWQTGKKLGEGSYGVVYEVAHTVNGRTEKAALKVMSIPKGTGEISQLRQLGSTEEEIRSRYREGMDKIRKEYDVLEKIQDHSNIVQTLGLKTIPHADGIGWDVYILMELLTKLSDHLDRAYQAGSTPEAEAKKLGMDLARALVECEKRKVIHRDIKPQNILVTEQGVYKLADFGQAKTLDEATLADSVAGSPHYMAPEVSGYRPYDHRADIYSLGLVMYWVLNDRRLPFEPPAGTLMKWDDPQKALTRRVSGEPLPLPAHGDKALQETVRKACDYRPFARHSTAAELLEELENPASAISGRTEPEAQTVQSTKKAEKESKKTQETATKTPNQKLPIALLSAACAVLVVLLAFFVGKSFSGPKTPAVTAPQTVEAAPQPAAVMAEPEEPAEEEQLPEAEEEPAAEPERVTAAMANLGKGDYVSFGTYPQSSKGNDQTPIEWKVLAREGNRILLVSRYALDCRQYHSAYEAVTWEESDLRAWLNQDFLTWAFSSAEQEAILTTTVTADKNPSFSTDPGNDTQDKVFLLSVPEAKRYIGEKALCVPTAYAVSQGAETSASFTENGKATCWWWLRTPAGNKGRSAAYVDTKGIYKGNAHDVRHLYPVRPAIWVSVE